MGAKRVVITGLGGICALGHTAPEIWNAMAAGRSAIGAIAGEALHDVKTNVGSADSAIARARTGTAAHDDDGSLQPAGRHRRR